MLELYEPKLEELWFRQSFLSDEETMSYNHAWGGTIPFPQSCWDEWYEHWLVRHENRRFYRYLRLRETGEFVGEVAFHFDGERQLWLADVIVFSPFRGRGFGTEGLRLLCEAARDAGVGVLYDDIAADNKAVSLFLRAGFVEEYRTEQIIMLKKVLN